MKKQFIISLIAIIFILALMRIGVIAYSQKETTPAGVVSFDVAKKDKIDKIDKIHNIDKTDKTELLFLGDVMLDRYNRSIIQKNGTGFLTNKIQKIFSNKDENIINLEGPVTNNNSVCLDAKETERNHFVFTFSPDETKTFLTENKIDIVNLGNNHMENFGLDGINQTKNNLKNFGVEYFGDPTDENNFVLKEINGTKVGFVNFNEFSKITAEKTARVIKEAKKASDFVVVYTHWGQEYKLTENEKQQALAHLFIDSGADLIIGSHPHVVQPIEIYKNKVIFYSLGNFVFDQYFSEDVKTRLAVSVSISKEKTEFILEPLYLEKNGQLILADENRRSNLFKRLAETSVVNDLMKKAISKGVFIIDN